MRRPVTRSPDGKAAPASEIGHRRMCCMRLKQRDGHVLCVPLPIWSHPSSGTGPRAAATSSAGSTAGEEGLLELFYCSVGVIKQLLRPTWWLCHRRQNCCPLADCAESIVDD